MTIHSPATDVLVPCVAHFDEIGCQKLWFKTGGRSHLQYVLVHALSRKIGKKLCKTLPAFHTLTGCDTASALAGVGKQKPWETLCRNEVHHENFAVL